MQYFNLFLILDDGHPKYLGTTPGRSHGDAAQTVLQALGYDMAHFNRRQLTYYGMELRHVPRSALPEGLEVVTLSPSRVSAR